MAKDKRQLSNVVARLVNLGKSTREIFTFLKSDRKFKFTNTKVISDTIERFRVAFERGRAANKLGSDKQIKDIFKKDKKKAPTRICVNYEFTHNSGGKSVRGSVNGAQELGSVEVNTTDTIGDVKEQILGVIQLWLDKHYETSNKREIKSSLKITSIQEC